MQPAATTGLIRDEAILNEDIPPARERMVARDEEFERLRLALAPIERGEQIESIRVFGPQGTGKSHTTRVMLDHLEQQRSGFDWTALSCHERDTRTQILATAVAAVTNQTFPGLQNRSHAELRSELSHNVTRPLLVVCDEVDILDDDAMLALRDILRTPDCALALIANDEEDFFDGVPPSLESRLKGSYHVQFDEYSVSDLVAILEQRTEFGLHDGVVSRRDLEAIAREAQGNGSARQAIVTLRKAVKVAASRGRTSISVEDIEIAAPDARQYIRNKDYERLGESLQRLVDVIEADSEEWVSCTRVREQYDERMGCEVGGRKRRRLLNKLQNYGFIERRGDGKGAEYRYLELY